MTRSTGTISKLRSKRAHRRDGPRHVRDPTTRLWIRYHPTLLNSVGSAVTQVEWAVVGQDTRSSRYVSEHLPCDQELQAFVLDEARAILRAAQCRRASLADRLVRICGPDPLANRQFARWLAGRSPHRFRLSGHSNQEPTAEPRVPVVVTTAQSASLRESQDREIRVFLAPTPDAHETAKEWPALERRICNQLEVAGLRRLLRHTGELGR